MQIFDQEIYGPQLPIVGRVDEMPKAWAIVEYWKSMQPGAPPACVLIVATKLRDVFLFVEANRNAEWRRLTALDPTTMVYIRKIADKLTCQREATARIVANTNAMPHCNLFGFNSYHMSRPIKCSNGQIYASQTEAASQLGLNPSHISRHLKGELRSVRGHVFAYHDTRETTGHTEPPIARGEY